MAYVTGLDCAVAWIHGYRIGTRRYKEEESVRENMTADQLIDRMRAEILGTEAARIHDVLDSYARFLATGENPNVFRGLWYATRGMAEDAARKAL